MAFHASTSQERKSVVRPQAAGLGFAIVCLMATCVLGQTPATRPVDRKTVQIRELEAYYADLYSKPLASKNRLARLVGVISMTRMDGEALAQKLLDAMKAKDQDLLVAQVCWEALHARQQSLTPAQRAEWLDGGLALSARGGFPASAAVRVIAALGERPVTPEIVTMLGRFIEENDPKTERGKAAFDAVAPVVGTWSDPNATRQLINRFSGPSSIDRMNALFARLPNAPAESDPAKLRTAWAAYSIKKNLRPPADLPPYTGVSTHFPVPPKVTDPDDRRWRKELELGDLKISGVEVVFCIDATGSMAKSNAYVTTYLATTLQMLRLMSDQVRAGTVYYRHETDPVLMQDCCRRGTENGGFRTFVLPFTSDGDALVKAMQDRRADRKAGHGKAAGAYCAGLAAAMNEMKWTKGYRHIIACTGDARPTDGSEDALMKLAQQIKAGGTSLMFVISTKGAANGVESPAKAAMGRGPILYGDDIKAMVDGDPARHSTMERFRQTAFASLVEMSIQSVLPKEYQDRAAPLMDIVFDMLTAQSDAAAAKAVKPRDRRN